MSGTAQTGAARPERVLLTGAAGRIGASLRTGLRASGLRELRLSDIEPLTPEHPAETVAPADLRDAGAVLRAARGVDAIVHLGGVPGEADLPTLAGPNLHGAFHVLDAARRGGARRVVMASSNHVTGFEPAPRRLAGHEAPRPDSLYGATKAFDEALGSLYADKFGLEVVCLRIGTFAERPLEARHLSSWLSPADALRLVWACLTAASPLGFRVVYGASANTRGWWDLGPARSLGYAPHDDAEAFAGELAPAGAQPPAGPQGGSFADRDHGGWTTEPDPDPRPENEPLPSLRGERLLLRPARADDAATIAAILAEPEVARWWGPSHLDGVRRELHDLRSFALVLDGSVAGWLHVHEEADPAYPSVAFDIAVTTSLRGRGYGEEALRVAVRHFAARGHHRFTIDPAADNERAIRAYARVGFKPVGVMRAYERTPEGAPRDGLLMDLLADELEG